MKKTVLIWTLAVVVTLASAVYQRLTGPTFPLKEEVTLGGAAYALNLTRSHGGPEDVVMELPVAEREIEGSIHYRRYPTNDPWRSEKLIREDDLLLGTLPHQPPAGKLSYYLVLSNGTETKTVPAEQPVVIRFKGWVPASVLVPHVLLMFTAMLMSNVSGLMVLPSDQRYKAYSFLTFGLLLVGGMILGPMMQLYAFGELWTGVPFGWDLTDNKTLIAFLAWGTALLGNRRKRRPYLVLAASLVTLAIYLIPHSMWGSELDPETGKILTG